MVVQALIGRAEQSTGFPDLHRGWWLPRKALSVSRARHRARDLMREWGEPDDRGDTAALLVSELFSNAVVHTSSDCDRIWYRLDRRCASGPVRLDLWARDDVTPLPHQASPCAAEDTTVQLAEGGRGLFIVKALTTTWGTRPLLGGRHVWAEF